MTPVLKTTGISVRFGGVHAVDDVDLEVADGQLVGLIGPNGAGKTTFIDAISGFVRYDGRVELDGADLTGQAPHVRARRGLARTWQSIELFDDLSIAENLLVASHRPSVWRTVRETLTPPRGGSDEIDPVLALLGLEAAADRLPTELSQGQRKLAGIARALVVRPRTTSTSFISGTGLKKCRPPNRSGRFVRAASSVTQSDEVLEARIVWAPTTPSSAL